MSPVFERIKAYNHDRLPELLPVKYAALRENVFRFYRGTAHLFYEDLAAAKAFADGPKTWICGDLHLENYGTYKGDNRLIYFDINDFDECVLAPVLPEVLRLVTSIYVASKGLQLDQARADDIASRFLAKYLTIVLAGKPHSFQRETTHGIINDLIQAVGKRKDKELLEKRTEHHKGLLQLSIIQGKTMQTPDDKAAELRKAFAAWTDKGRHPLKLVDIASRIMGTGSLGLERYILLCLDVAEDKPILLDLKEAGQSCVLKYFGFRQPSWGNDALRVIGIQSLLQDTPPAFLHDFSSAGRSYVIKELQPSQDKLDLAEVSQKNHKFDGVIEGMADITASAHLRGTGRYTAETVDSIIAFMSGVKQNEILEYARDYSRKVESDFQEYAKAAGR